MATTQETIQDRLRWVGRMLRIAARRAVVIGVCVALFTLAVVVSTRERVSDCGDVTDTQRAGMAQLAEPSPDRSFRAVAEPACETGEFMARIERVAGDIEAATVQLVADGWQQETNFVSYLRNTWQRCFSFAGDGFEGVQVIVDAGRSGKVRATKVVAPENADACELERRETSRIYPPRS